MKEKGEKENDIRENEVDRTKIRRVTYDENE